MENSDKLRQATKVIRAGFHQQGEAILKNILRKEPRNERAWLWLAYIVKPFDEKIDYIRCVLKINPHNIQAQKAFRALFQDIKSQQTNLATQQVEQNHEQERLEIWEGKLVQREQVLEQRKNNLDEMTLQIEQTKANLEEKERRLQTEQQQLVTEREELQQRLAELEKREHSISLREKALETQSQEIEATPSSETELHVTETSQEIWDIVEEKPPEPDESFEVALEEVPPIPEPNELSELIEAPQESESEIYEFSPLEANEIPEKTTSQKHEKPTNFNIFKSQRYHKWNQAILNYLLHELPSSSPVFLTIDDETLVNIATFMNNPPPVEERVTDFINAVRDRCVQEGHLLLGLFDPKPNFDDTPPYLGFLAVMVLAAYRMAEDEDVAQTDYFTRLNEILGLPDNGRPDGLHGEIEFWQHWAKWLTQQSYQPTAKGGYGPYKYIGYPISQTLLRNSDKDSLRQYFSVHHWPKNLDDNAVIRRINQNKQYLTKHLERALEKDALYVEGLNRAIINEYNLWCDTVSDVSDSKQLSRQASIRNITAGLYRTVDFFTGESEYWLHPRQPRHIQTTNLSIYDDNKEEYQLIPDRPGWFSPLEIMVTPAMLNQGMSLNFTSDSELEQLILPIRDFWLLIPDPEDSEMGDYATWGQLELGISFVLLCKKSLQVDLKYLKQNGLIDWESSPRAMGDDWFEYTDLMVISEDWSSISIQHEELYNSLQPQSSLGVSLQGGIRVPQGRGWLVKHGPQVIIRSVQAKAKLILINNSNQQTKLILDEMDTNQPIPIEWQTYPAGSYKLTVYAGTDEKNLQITLIEWTELDMETIPLSTEITSFEKGSVFGAYVMINE